MLHDSPAIERLIDAFRKLPGVGKRTAERYAFHLLSAPEEDATFLSEAVREARKRISRCAICRNLTEEDPCRICSNDRRDHSTICIVEQPSGAMAVEKGGAFNGTYHVLHGALSPLDGIGPDELEIGRLFRRLEDGKVGEIIVATNATTEGEATAMYIQQHVDESKVKVSRIAHGVPMGGGLEFSDEVTLAHALQGRKSM